MGKGGLSVALAGEEESAYKKVTKDKKIGWRHSLTGRKQCAPTGDSIAKDFFVPCMHFSYWGM
jgi:hypothetical protein